MRVLVSIGIAIALVRWPAGAIFASPTPILPAQRAAPPATGLSLYATSFGQHPQSTNQGVLYSFPAGADAGPQGPLADVNGVLYGASCPGGLSYYAGPGTVFAVNEAGTEKVLHRFGNGIDGNCPLGGLVDVNGVLYGTTFYGGKYGQGTVFAITTAGTERVIHDFGGGPDGGNPSAGLIDVNGVLYGTTEGGGGFGGYGPGSVFAITTDGRERVLHNFGTGADGAYPWAGVIDENGVLYGTTQAGGAYGEGTVFEVTAAGTERVLYSFRGGTDGSLIFGGLVSVNGVFYGTTFLGGKYGQGTVYALSTTGIERVLHSFGSGSDGQEPFASLIAVNGNLFGTTPRGGRYGNGTIFTMTSAGVERVLRNFEFCKDANSQLLYANGLLYGTTDFGGTYNAGALFFEPPSPSLRRPRSGARASTRP